MQKGVKMAETSVYFKADKNTKKTFDVAVAGTDYNNKQILNAFIEKFSASPAETLNFLGLKNE